MLEWKKVPLNDSRGYFYYPHVFREGGNCLIIQLLRFYCNADFSSLCLYTVAYFLKDRALTEKKKAVQKKENTIQKYFLCQILLSHTWSEKNLIEIHQNLFIILYIHAHFGCFLFSRASTWVPRETLLGYISSTQIKGELHSSKLVMAFHSNSRLKKFKFLQL